MDLHKGNLLKKARTLKSKSDVTIDCPVCRQKFPYRVSVISADDNTGQALLQVQPDTRKVDHSLELWIAKVWIQYARWVIDGKKPYGYRADEQLYYDSYHTGISKTDDKNLYTFSFQTFDSPEGDSWMNGKFSFDGTTFEVTEKKSSRR